MDSDLFLLQNAYLALLRLTASDRMKLQPALCQLRNSLSMKLNVDCETVQGYMERKALEQNEEIGIPFGKDMAYTRDCGLRGEEHIESRDESIRAYWESIATPE